MFLCIDVGYFMKKQLLVRGNEVMVGDVIAEDVWDNNGNLILGEGLEVSEERVVKINRMYNRRIRIVRQIDDMEAALLYMMPEPTDDQEEDTNRPEIDINHRFVRYSKAPDDVTYKIEDRIKIELLKSMKYMFDKNTGKDMVDCCIEASKVISALIFDRHNNGFVSMNEIKISDEYIYKHSFDVAYLAGILGKKLGLPMETIQNLSIAGMLHDIGKKKVPLEILNKPGKLTKYEFDIVKKHPRDSFEIIKSDRNLNQDIKMGILCHHERFDGTGYRNHLSGDSIPFFAQILMIADVYDALVSKRVYKDAITPREAVSEMLNMGESFAPEIFNAFKQILVMFPTGALVYCSDNAIRKVVCQNSDLGRPWLSDLADTNCINLSDPLYSDIRIVCEADRNHLRDLIMKGRIA